MGSTLFRILQTLINPQASPSGFCILSVFNILNPVDPLASVSSLYLNAQYVLVYIIVVFMMIMHAIISSSWCNYAGSNSESTTTVSIISGTLGSLLVVALLVCGILIIVIVILRKKGNNTIPTWSILNAGIKFLSAGIAISSSEEQKSGQMKVIKMVWRHTENYSTRFLHG